MMLASKIIILCILLGVGTYSKYINYLFFPVSLYLLLISNRSYLYKYFKIPIAFIFVAFPITLIYPSQLFDAPLALSEFGVYLISLSMASTFKTTKDFFYFFKFALIYSIIVLALYFILFGYFLIFDGYSFLNAGNQVCSVLFSVTFGLFYKPFAFIPFAFLLSIIGTNSLFASLVAKSVGFGFIFVLPLLLRQLLVLCLLALLPSRSIFIGAFISLFIYNLFTFRSFFINNLLFLVSKNLGFFLIFIISTFIPDLLSLFPFIAHLDPRIILWSQLSLFTGKSFGLFLGPGHSLIDDFLVNKFHSSLNGVSYESVLSLEAESHLDPTTRYLMLNQLGFESDLFNAIAAYGLLPVLVFGLILSHKLFSLLDYSDIDTSHSPINVRLVYSLLPVLFVLELALFLAFIFEDRGSTVLTWFFVFLLYTPAANIRLKT